MPEIALFVFSFAVALSSQWPALLRPYVLNDDARQHLFWMQQFRDPSLFRDDFLTAYAKNFQPWGFVALYRVFSFFADPYLLSQWLPMILLPVSVLLAYRLMKEASGVFGGLLAALMLAVTPAFLMRMVGGLSRGFAFPLMLAFLYYFVRKEYANVAFSLVLQALFYPMALPVSFLAYGFSMFGFRDRRPVLCRERGKWIALLVSVLVCSSILAGKYATARDPRIGTVMNRSQVVNNPDFYLEGGRDAYLPLEPLWKVFLREAAGGILTPFVYYNTYKAEGGADIPGYKAAEMAKKAAVLILLLFWLAEICRKKTRPPAIFFWFLLSGILMYPAAAAVMLKLYWPARYIEYPAKLMALILAAASAAHLISKIRAAVWRRGVQALCLAFVLFHSGMNSKNTNLMSMAANAPVFEFLKKLPKDSLIAAHPFLADGIPYFSGRKVFLMHELSNPMYTPYWETIKQRTYGFFDAYYSEDPGKIYEFLSRNGIDFVVVSRLHFIPPYLMAGDFYFEPFNAAIRKIVRQKNRYAMVGVPREMVLFDFQQYFVVHRDVYKMIALAQSSARPPETGAEGTGTA